MRVVGKCHIRHFMRHILGTLGRSAVKDFVYIKTITCNSVVLMPTSKICIDIYLDLPLIKLHQYSLTSI